MHTTPWDDFQNALHRHGRQFAEIQHCASQPAVIHSLGFTDPLTIAAIESKWRAFLDSSPSEKAPSPPQPQPTPHPAIDTSNTLFAGVKGPHAVCSHFSTLSPSHKEHCLIESLLLAVNGTPSALIRCVGQSADFIPISSDPLEWASSPTFTIDRTIDTSLRSALLPCLTLIDAHSHVQTRAAFLNHHNLCVSPNNAVKLNASAQALGKAIHELSQSFKSDIHRIEQKISLESRLADVVHDVQTAGAPICLLASLLWKIDALPKASFSQTRNIPQALCIQPSTASSNAETLLNVLHSFWQTNKGIASNEAVAASLLTESAKDYLSLVLHWAERGVVPEVLWRSFFSDDQSKAPPFGHTLPAFLLPSSKFIIESGIAAQRAKALWNEAGPRFHSKICENLEKPVHTDFPRFDSCFIQELHTRIAQTHQNAAVASVKALCSDYAVGKLLRHIHRVYFGVSNDWIGAFIRESWPVLSQPAVLARSPCALTANMQRVLTAERIVPADFTEIIAFGMRSDAIQHNSSVSHGQRVYSHLALEVGVPAILKDIGLFGQSAMEAYSALFRFILWVKCIAHMVNTALNVVLRLAKAKGDAETLCIRRLVDRFGRFVRHYLIVVDAVCQNEEVSAMHGENGAKASIPAIIAAHESVLQSILEKCFLANQTRRAALSTALSIAEKVLLRLFGVVSARGAVCIPDALVDGRRVDYSDLAADVIEERSESDGYTAIEAEFVRAVDAIFEDEEGIGDIEPSRNTLQMRLWRHAMKKSAVME